MIFGKRKTQGSMLQDKMNNIHCPFKNLIYYQIKMENKNKEQLNTMI